MNPTANVLQMQREAADRVRQMEERSRRLVREHPVNIYRGVTFTPPREAASPRQEPTPRQEPPARQTSCEPACETQAPPREPLCEASKQSCDQGLLSLFGGDKERLLLLLVAVVLLKNNASPQLILALLYVAL